MTETEFLHEIFHGDQDAVAFCQLLGRISQTLDDIVDAPGSVDLYRVFTLANEALFDLPENAFYKLHQAELHPLMRLALHDWCDATTLERDGIPTDYPTAYALRDSLVSVVVQAARIVGGTDHAFHTGPVIQRYLRNESLADYLKNLP